MKTIKNLKTVFVILIAGLALNSCVTDDEFDTPPVEFEEPDLEVNSSISKVKELYNNSGAIAPLLIEDSLVLEAYVVSSDKEGNFYKEMIIQSSPEDPEAGISIQTEATDLYTFFEPGRKVYVKLAGLYVGDDGGGVLSLGGEVFDGGVGRLSPQAFEKHVLRSGEVAEIVPNVVPIDELTTNNLNTLVKLENMQFPRELLGETYSETNDNFSGINRDLESCETGQIIILRNSDFLNFSNKLLPEGSGSITAVLGSFNGEAQLYIRDTDDVVFDQERCDPEFLTCEGPFGGTHIIFSEDFEGYNNFSEVEASGWININVNSGPTKFVLGNFNNNNYAQISGFNTGESEILTYLVSPEINLDSTNEEALVFDLEVAYANSQSLTVLVTDNFTGDVTTTSWSTFDVDIPNTPTDTFGGFNTVDEINISCLDGNIRVAFLYQGSDPSATTRYHIDNFQVNGVQ